MNRRICLQAGHINCQFNSIVALRGSTGAPGEQELTKRITDRVATLLREHGFDVKQTDANANDDAAVRQTDWDMFLAIHGDADNPNNAGGTVGVCDPKTDGAAAESGRIANVIRSNYFPETQITDLKFTTVNILQYYMWKYLSAKTPCVLIELGQVQDPHDKVLLANTDLIANALARSVCVAFGVEWVAAPPPPVTPPPTEDPKDKIIADLTTQLEQARKAQADAFSDFQTKLAAQQKECQDRLAKVTQSATDIINICKA